MGKTFRKDKTISKQRSRLNTKGRKDFPYREFDYDPTVDEKRWSRQEEDKNASRIQTIEELPGERSSKSDDKEGN